MSISLYDASIPVFVHGFKTLAKLVDKANDHADAAGMDPLLLVDARLAPDMYTFAGQIQRASDAAKSSAARLAGMENPSMPDFETTLPELRSRIEKTVSFLSSIDPASIDNAAHRNISLSIRGEQIDFTSQAYLLKMALPNFFFHVATAYDILRHAGVQIGKKDYLALS